MPFRSKAQMRFMFANPHILGGEDKVKEWADATPNPHLLPERVGTPAARPAKEARPIGADLSQVKSSVRGPGLAKPGPKKFTPASSLHRLVAALVDRKKED